MRRLVLLVLCASRVASAQPVPPPAPPTPPPPPPGDGAAVEPPVAPEVTPVPPDAVPTPTPTPDVSAPPAPTEREKEAMAPYEPSSFTVGGYLQPQYRFRQDSSVPFDQNGFRFARARLTGLAQTRAGNLELSAFLEAELQPTFDMVDAFATVARKLPQRGRISVDVGQMRVPISRQQLLSDSRLSFVDKAQVASIAPKRDLGARLAVVIPKLPQVRIVAGAFNGEGPNQVENINQRYLYAGRLEITPLGKEAQLAESAFGGRFVTLALSAGFNTLTPGDTHEEVRYAGLDLAAAYRGASGSFEILQVSHDLTSKSGSAMVAPSYKALGWVAQAAYLLPFKLAPYKQSRIELGVRVEEIDRNDTVPIRQAGEPEQSVRELTAVATYYLRMHSLKAQLAVSHFQEIETETVLREDAVYANDQVLLQVTYRLE